MESSKLTGRASAFGYKQPWDWWTGILTQDLGRRGIAEAPLAPPPKPCKLLDKIKGSPKNDWEISDLQTVSAQIGLTCTSPTRGSHFKFSSPVLAIGILPIPHRKPVKLNYIKEFIKLADAHLETLRTMEAPDE